MKTEAEFRTELYLIGFVDEPNEQYHWKVCKGSFWIGKVNWYRPRDVDRHPYVWGIKNEFNASAIGNFSKFVHSVKRQIRRRL